MISWKVLHDVEEHPREESDDDERHKCRDQSVQRLPLPHLVTPSGPGKPSLIPTISRGPERVTGSVLHRDRLRVMRSDTKRSRSSSTDAHSSRDPSRQVFGRHQLAAIRPSQTPFTAETAHRSQLVHMRATDDPILRNRAAGPWPLRATLPVRSALGVDAGMSRLTRLCRAVGVGLAVATATLTMTQVANAAQAPPTLPQGRRHLRSRPVTICSWSARCPPACRSTSAQMALSMALRRPGGRPGRRQRQERSSSTSPDRRGRRRTAAREGSVK